MDAARCCQSRVEHSPAVEQCEQLLLPLIADLQVASFACGSEAEWCQQSLRRRQCPEGSCSVGNMLDQGCADVCASPSTIVCRRAHTLVCLQSPLAAADPRRPAGHLAVVKAHTRNNIMSIASTCTKLYIMMKTHLDHLQPASRHLEFLLAR